MFSSSTLSWSKDSKNTFGENIQNCMLRLKL